MTNRIQRVQEQSKQSPDGENTYERGSKVVGTVYGSLEGPISWHRPAASWTKPGSALVHGPAARWAGPDRCKRMHKGRAGAKACLGIVVHHGPHGILWRMGPCMDRRCDPMADVIASGDQTVHIEFGHDLVIVSMIGWLWFKPVMIKWPKLILGLIWTRSPSEILF